MQPTTLTTGRLNRRISIQQQATAQDDDGSPLQTWTEIYKCWASVDVQKSQLLYSTAEFISKVTHRITMRWPPSTIVLPNMRILYLEPTTNISHTYEIEALLNEGQANVSLVALCYELNGAE